jgi:hypothetical protein
MVAGGRIIARGLFGGAGLLLLSLLLLAPGEALAAKTKNYAYLFVQGRLSDPVSKTALAGAEIRLTSEAGTFNTVTDPKGNFIFEKLPVATYRMHITTADGKVIERIEEIGLTLTGPKRYRARFARGPEAVPVIEPGEKGVTVTVPKPAVNWKRFWKQFAIFAGGALVLAL